MFGYIAIIMLLFCLILFYVWRKNLVGNPHFVLWLSGVMFGLGLACVGINIELTA